MTSPRSPWREALGARWAGMAPRERAALGVAALVLGAALLWQFALSPALATLRGAPERHRQLDAQMQTMLVLQTQARSLAQQPRRARAATLTELEASVSQRLGAKARLVVAGDQATLMLQGASPDALAQWLAQARTEARATPVEAQLTRNTSGLFDGRIQLALPQ